MILLAMVVVLLVATLPGSDTASAKKDSCSEICGLAVEDKAGRSQSQVRP